MSDRRRHVWRRCGRKNRYRTEGEAREMMRSALRKRPHQPLRVYWCSDCDGWHLTHAGLRGRP